MQTSPSSTQDTKASDSSTSAAKSGNASSTKTAAPSYTVSISSAAHAALLEASETSVQTQQEANHGDLQAQRLLTKEQTAKAQ